MTTAEPRDHKNMTGYTTPDAWAAYAHFAEFVGVPSSVYELPDPKGPRKRKLDVAVWTPMGPGSTALISTIGGCDRAMSNGRYAEVFMLARPAPDEETMGALGRFLKAAVRLPMYSGKPLKPGLRIVMKRERAPLDRFASVLVMPPVTFDEQFHVIRYRSGKRVSVYWLIPLFAAEDDCCAAHGPSVLYELFAAQQTDLAVLGREPAQL